MAGVGPILQALEASAAQRQALMHARHEVMSAMVQRVTEEEEADAACSTADDSLLCCARTLSEQSSIANDDTVSHVSSQSIDDLDRTADDESARCPSTPPSYCSAEMARKRTPENELCDRSRSKRVRHEDDGQIDDASS